MRVWLEGLGYELVVPPVRLAGRRRIPADDALRLSHILRSGTIGDDADRLRGLLLGLGVIEAEAMAHADVVRHLVDQIRWGRIWLLELERFSAGIDHEPESYRPVEVAQKDWIEIQLVDESGAPVPGVDYEITLPDGRRRQGVTNAKGVVRFNGIEPGVCDFSFHKLDEEAWEPA